MFRLAQQVSPGAAFDFTGIPSGYSALVLEIFGASAVAATLDTEVMQLNGDTGANYYWNRIQGTATTVSAAEGTATTTIQIGNIPGSTASLANASGCFRIYIPAYSNTTFVKQVVISAGMWNTAGTGGGIVRETAGLWNNTAAINRIVVGSGNNWATGSIGTLYGVA